MEISGARPTNAIRAASGAIAVAGAAPRIAWSTTTLR
jgi:hypothetical protein